MASYQDVRITDQFLNDNPNALFVFGDNLIRKGYGGAAVLRDHPQAIGFVTKKFPDNRDTSFYDPVEYESLFFQELKKLEKMIEEKPDKTFYISQLGGGLANRYNIWGVLIQPNIVGKLQNFDNVVFCFQQE
jgi:hypothetical protein